MADIRINALATTAASTASDDFVAVDGSANGTRKLNAYSPTFGGNLTVSGSITGNTILADTVSATTNDQIETASFKANTSGTADVGFGPKQRFYAENNTGSLGVIGEIAYKLESASTYSSSLVLRNRSGGDINDVLTIAANKNATLTGNLTVSGTGTSTFGGNIAIPATYALYLNGSGGDTYLLEATGDKISAVVGGTQRAYFGESNSYISNNLLIGTTTDGGQKLQVSGTMIATGLGTYGAGLRITGGTLATSGEIVANSAHGLIISGSTGSLNDFAIFNAAADTIIMKVPTGTLNAEFAGKVTVNGTDGLLINKSASMSLLTMGDNIAGSFSRFNMRNGGTKYAWSIATQDLVDNALTITPSTAVGGTTFTTPVLTVAQSGAVTVSGAIAIGNTVQTATAVASTHKVTISIGGSTYYLLATNV